jgi:hypothetical protein
MVVLDWNGTTIGTGTDRIGAIWISGAEIFRTSTPETDGASWHVEKDVSEYSSLFTSSHNVTSIVTAYSGKIKVVASLSFYETSQQYPEPSIPEIIVPVSNAQGSPWFTISNSQTQGNTTVTFRKDTMNVTLEVYATAHKCDETWFDSYVIPVPGCSGNDAFREIQVLLDGNLSGLVWPVPVIYTGGINENLWETIPSVNALNIPPVVVPFTPFASQLADGRPHTIGFKVVGDEGYWLVDANLLVDLDPHVQAVAGELTGYNVPDASRRDSVNIDWLLSRATISQDDSRDLTISGYVNSSIGTIETTVKQKMSMSNTQVVTRNHLAESFSAEGSVTTTIITTDMGILRNETEIESYSVGFSQSIVSTNGILIIEVDENVQLQHISSLNGVSSMELSSDLVVAHSNGHTSEDYSYTTSSGICYDRHISTTHGSITNNFETTNCR